MASAHKTYTTAFNIVGHYQAGPAFAATQKALHATTAAAQNASVSIGKLFSSVVGGILASHAVLHAWGEIKDVWKESFDAAMELNSAMDTLTLSLERLADKGVLARGDVHKQAEEFLKLGEEQEKTGLKLETLLSMYGDLSKFLRPGQIKAMSAGFQDWMTKVSRGAPSIEKEKALVALINKYIQTGSKRALYLAGWTKEEVDNLGKVGSARARAEVIAKRFNHATGEYARWAKTIPGLEYERSKSLDAIFRALGAGRIEPYKQFLVITKELYDRMLPVAQVLGQKMRPAFERFNADLKKNQGTIVKYFGYMGDFFVWIIDHWKEVVIGLSGILAAILAFKAISTAIGILGAFKNLLILLASPEGLLVLALIAIGALALAIYENWDKVGPIVVSTWNKIKAAWDPIDKWFLDKWENVKKGLEKAQVGIKNVWFTIKTNAINMFEEARNWIKLNFFDKIVEYFDLLPDWIKDPLQKIYDAVVNKFRDMWEKIKQYWEAFKTGISSAQLPPTTSGIPTSSDPDAMAPEETGTGYPPYERESRQKQANAASDAVLDANARAAKARVGDARHPLSKEPVKKPFDKGSYPDVVPGAKPGASINVIKGAIAANTDPWGIRYGGWNQPPLPPPPKPLNYGAPRGSSLRNLYRSMNMRERLAGQGEQLVTMNAPINIHGVAGDPQAVGRAVHNALSNASKDLIERMKEARAYEVRRTYA